MSSPFIIIDEIGSLIASENKIVTDKIGAGNASAHGTTYATTDTLFGRIRFIADTLIGTNKKATANKDGNIMEKLNYLSSNIPNVSALTNGTYGLSKINDNVNTIINNPTRAFGTISSIRNGAINNGTGGTSSASGTGKGMFAIGSGSYQYGVTLSLDGKSVSYYDSSVIEDCWYEFSSSWSLQFANTVTGSGNYVYYTVQYYS